MVAWKPWLPCVSGDGPSGQTVEIPPDMLALLQSAAAVGPSEDVEAWAAKLSTDIVAVRQ